LEERSVLFDEFEYLCANPDVAQAVSEGAFPNGEIHYEVWGKAEGRLLYDPNKSRVAKALFKVDKAGRGLEIGPSINPIAPKSQGFQVEILDHLSTYGLRTKYHDHGVNVDGIEEVDFVWSGEKLSALIGEVGCFDYIIASHVIEHIPDVISFLQECSLLLKPKGVLSLIIPDKRYCFDYFLPISTSGQFIDSYDLGRKKPTRGQVFDAYINSASTDSGSISWGENNLEKIKLTHASFDRISGLYEQASQDKDYVDAHCWRFTPTSFRLLISDLNYLSFINLNISSEFPTMGCEFYMSLQKGTFDPPLDRLEYLLKIDDELRGRSNT